MKDSQQQNTILDLAAALKLSPATVSRAMNNTSYVKKETRERVLEMAATLGYRKNTMAAGLRNNKTNTVGLILPQISMYFHAAVATVIQNLLHPRGYQLIIGQSNDDPAMEKDLADAFFSSRVDALLVSCTLYNSDFSHFDIFKTHQVPVLFYDRVPPLTYPALVIKGDDFNGGYLAGKRLAAAGCKCIALISGPDTSNLYRDRSAGFLQALHEEKLMPEDHLIYSQPLTAEHTLAALEIMFSAENKPDGIFVTSDRNAVTIVEFARKKGIAVPDQLKIIGYSNDPIAAVITPPVTTVAQFPALFAEKLVETLLVLLRADNATAVDVLPVVIPVELIERSSG